MASHTEFLTVLSDPNVSVPLQARESVPGSGNAMKGYGLISSGILLGAKYVSEFLSKTKR
jgi:hypothetical protein